MAVAKRKWVSPEIRCFGTFEAATQGCTKDYGVGDAFTFQNNQTTLVCSAS